MNWNLLIPLLITTFTVIGGWLAVHRMAAKRDQINKRRDLRVQYLIDAYRKLGSASNREKLSVEDAARIESAIADIQLFGNPAQVELAREFSLDFATKKLASVDKLLLDLRRELRRELLLEDVAGGVLQLRVEVPKKEI